MKRIAVRHPDTSVRNNLEKDSLKIMKYYSFVVYILLLQLYVRSLSSNTHIFLKNKTATQNT